MKRKRISETMNFISEDFISEANVYKKNDGKNATIGNIRRGKNTGWKKWTAAAACICLLVVGGFAVSKVLQEPKKTDVAKEDLQDKHPGTIQENSNGDNFSQDNASDDREVTFIAINSLLKEDTGVILEQALRMTTIPVDNYVGVYQDVPTADVTILEKSMGDLVDGTDNFHYVMGHTDLQYVIQKENEEYSLWKFSCFESEEYSYKDVLELVYGIDGADRISEIRVNPPNFDNTDTGKAIQEQIGNYTVTDKNQIETIYEILVSMTCYGDDHWDIIDNGMKDVSVDGKHSGNATRLGRYLTLVTDYGNEIDELKYTDVSEMFYEYSGIAYNRLEPEQAARVREILQIGAEMPE